MILKEEFLNLINDINSVASEHGYVNAKDWSNRAYTQGKLTFDEKEEFFRFIQMRNMVSMVVLIVLISLKKTLLN